MMRPLLPCASKLSPAGDRIQPLPRFAASLGVRGEGLGPSPARLFAILRGDPRWLYNSRALLSADSISLIWFFFSPSRIKPPATLALYQLQTWPGEFKQLLTVRGEQGLIYTLGDGHTSKCLFVNPGWFIPLVNSVSFRRHAMSAPFSGPFIYYFIPA